MFRVKLSYLKFFNLALQGKVFVFDKVLKPNVTQEYVYTVTAKPIVAGKRICKHTSDIYDYHKR